MREILFRGKPINKSECANLWIEGFYTKSPSGRIRILTTYNARPIEVIPETIGQFTGLTDKNGKKIFEGDIISTDLDRPFNIVVFRNGAFMFQCHDSGKDYYDYMFSVEEESDRWEYGEVIGNIYEHPHLLKEGVTL